MAAEQGEELFREDGSRFEVGDRISKDGHIGTVRFIGLVTATNGVWLGVDWDDPMRGKHDGVHQNHKYFHTRHPTSGSFIRPFKVEIGMNVLNALQDRYGLKEGTVGVNEEELFVLDSKFNKTVIEMVGADKVNKLQSTFNRLKKICFYDMNIYGAGPSQDFGRMCPSITDLDVSRNLVASWESLSQITKQLPHLRELNVSQNQLLIPKDPQSLSESFRCLKGVTMNKMGLTWDDILECCLMFPMIEEIHACFNNISQLSDQTEQIKGLKTLDLMTNDISSWDQLLKLAHLPHLETLFLNENQIGSAYLPDCGPSQTSDLFKSLKVIFIKDNQISEWSTINEFNKLGKLEEVEISGNPIMKTYNPETIRQLRIAKLEKLKIVSRTHVTYDERKGAEIDYLKRFGADWRTEGGNSEPSQNKPSQKFITDHPRFQKLVEKWGAPEESEMQEKPKTIKDSLIEVKISSTAHVDKSGILTKKLPGTISVLKLKTLIQRIFKMNGEPTLTYTSHRREKVPEINLDNDMRQLNFYSIESGDILHVKWANC